MGGQKEQHSEHGAGPQEQQICKEERDKKYFPQMFIELTEEVRVLKDMSDFFFLIYADSTGSMVV